MNNENEQLKREINALRVELSQLRQDLLLHTHNGLDSGKEFQAPIITGGILQTSKVGLRLVMSGEDNAYEFRSDGLLLADLKSTTVPFSGLSGAALRHGTGTIMIEVSGQGEGLGSRQILMTNADGDKYFGLVDDDAGGFTLRTTLLPTSNPGGSGVLWNDVGTVKIT